MYRLSDIILLLIACSLIEDFFGVTFVEFLTKDSTSLVINVRTEPAIVLTVSAVYLTTPSNIEIVSGHLTDPPSLL